MTEIAERLRDADKRGVAPPQNWTTEAADEIERLRKECDAIEAQAVKNCDEVLALREQLAAAQPTPAAVPLTDEQIDKIWDGTFNVTDPKRQLSFRQIITRAIELAHGIGEKP